MHQKGTILNRQKRLNPGLTPGAPRRETGLALLQTITIYASRGNLESIRHVDSL